MSEGRLEGRHRSPVVLCCHRHFRDNIGLNSELVIYLTAAKISAEAEAGEPFAAGSTRSATRGVFGTDPSFEVPHGDKTVDNF